MSDPTPKLPEGAERISILLSRSGKQFLRFQPNGYDFPIELPVILSGSRKDSGAWTWNGDVEKPTLKPSIKTTHGGSGKISHLWLNDGVCQHLEDSTDGLAGQTLPLIPLGWQCDHGDEGLDHDWKTVRDSSGEVDGGPGDHWEHRECRACGVIESAPPPAVAKGDDDGYEDGSPICVKCRRSVTLRHDSEHDGFCDSCAHEALAEAKRERDEAKQLFAGCNEALGREMDESNKRQIQINEQHREITKLRADLDSARNTKAIIDEIRISDCGAWMSTRREAPQKRIELMKLLDRLYRSVGLLQPTPSSEQETVREGGEES